MDPEGLDIVGEKLGLLLYKRGTVCKDDFNYTAAHAICREMNHTYATRWTVEERFDIQYEHEIKMSNVVCGSADWENCSYSVENHCQHSEDVFLSCTGNNVRFIKNQPSFL